MSSPDFSILPLADTYLPFDVYYYHVAFLVARVK
jgi:hypothetical protein